MTCLISPLGKTSQLINQLTGSREFLFLRELDKEKQTENHTALTSFWAILS